MKKLISSLSACLLLSVLFVMPPKIHAATCNTTVVDVTDYPVEVTTDIYFRKTIKGGEGEDCPESEVIGSFGTGQVLWVLGKIETGAIINEETQEYGSWLYVKHPTKGDYGFIWSANAKKIDVPQGQENHVEEVIGQPDPEKECETITDVTDYFVKITDSLNVRNGVCNGTLINALKVDDVVKVIGKIGEWHYIELPGGGKGFIHSDYTVSTQTPTGRENEPEVTIGVNEKAYVGPEPAPVAPTNQNGSLQDVVGHVYEMAIRYLEANDVVEGYPDGLFKADIFINRAEFTKIVVGAKLKANPSSSAANCFPDVTQDAWYASYVCYAKDSGIVKGHPDGMFKPGDNINFVEAAKILANTFGLNPGQETGVWYEVYVDALQKNNYIPASITKLDQWVNRGEMAEMIWRILEKINNKSSTQFNLATGQNTSPPTQGTGLQACTDTHLPNSINMTKVREAWLEWHNAKRKELGLPLLTLHEGLNYSSTVWAKDNKAGGQLTHTRGGGQTTSDWFKSLGITFKPLSGYVYAENIGLQTYTCNEADCTDEAIAASKVLFDAFVNEAGSNSTKHYDNLVESDYKQLGLGIAIDQTTNRLYLTTHYAQAVDTYPSTCQ